MNESTLKKEVRNDTLKLFQEIIWCNHQDKVQVGIADSEIVYKKETIWIEFKFWQHKTLNSPLLQERYLKPLQLGFLLLRYKAGIPAYCGVFVDRDNLLLITPNNIDDRDLKQIPVAHHISRKGIWNLNPIFEEYAQNTANAGLIVRGEKWFE